MKNKTTIVDIVYQMALAFIIIGALLWASEFVLDYFRFLYREWHWKDY